MIRASEMQIAVLVPREAQHTPVCWPRLDLRSDGLALAGAELTPCEWRTFTRAVPMTVDSVVLGGFTTTIELKGAPTMPEAQDVPAAHGVRVRHDNGGCLVEFLDVRGEPVAVADFEPGTFARFIGECCDLLEIVSKGGLATIECRGQA